MSKAASKKNSPTLQQQIDAANKRVRETDHRKNLLEARARGAKAGVKAAKKAFKLAKKAARKAAKAAKRTHKELRVLVKQANQKPYKAKPTVKAKAKSKAPATPARKRPVRKPVSQVTNAIPADAGVQSPFPGTEPTSLLTPVG
jgi:hypothetical protein